MPLPPTNDFEALLGSFTIEPPGVGGNWSHFRAVPAKLVNEDYDLAPVPAVGFWYRNDTDISFESLLKRIVEELRKLGHVSNIQTASIIAAVFAHTKGTAGCAVGRFNLVFERVVDADVNQFFLFPELVGAEYRATIGPFSIGPFNPEKLAYASRKSGSDYYDRYEAGLRKLPFSVERESRRVRVIYWHRIFDTEPQWRPLSKPVTSVVGYLVDEYFANQSALHFASFFAELHEVQEVPMALGSGWFDLETLREALGSHQISVYLNIGGDNTGHVSPSVSQVMNINLGGGHVGVPLTGGFLRRHFGFEGYGDSEVHQSLQSYCHFLALAAKHRVEGRPAEGFLHGVIALDLLLGDAGASSNSVSKRSAALVHREQGLEFLEMVRMMVRIYNARSKYVHEGRSPESALAGVLDRICVEIAFCLFRLQREAANLEGGFRERWMKDIDYVVASIESGRGVTEEDLRRAGIATGQDVKHGDLRTELEKPLPHAHK